MQCSDCRYYDEGVCRRYPPGHHMSWDGSGDHKTVTVAIPVDGNAPICGEFKNEEQ